MRPLSPRQAAQVDNLELLGPTFKGRTASVSFRLDVIGITRAMAEREWGADAAVAEEVRRRLVVSDGVRSRP